MHHHHDYTTVPADTPPDPGDLLDRIDATTLPRVITYHTALDGQPHITPEDVERIAADLMPPSVWADSPASSDRRDAA